MKLRNTTILHELLILIPYFLLTPYAFSWKYPENISGDASLIYFVLLFIAGITVLLSLFIIAALKWNLKGSKIELGYGLIPLLISSVAFLVRFSGAQAPITTTFFFSNTILLIGLYACSMLYKIMKDWRN